MVAEENYGEGSSREHAAMEPRFLNVKVILAKSFRPVFMRRNLKKAGEAGGDFLQTKADYDKIQEHDLITVSGLADFAPGRNLTVTLYHEDGSKDCFEVQHTYNETADRLVPCRLCFKMQDKKMKKDSTLYYRRRSGSGNHSRYASHSQCSREKGVWR